MARADGFELSVVTPEKVAFESKAVSVVLPAHDGEMGILHNRAPLLVRLDVGSLRIETESGNETLYIDGGFAQMVDNKLTVLTEDSKSLDELDAAAAREALAAAQGLPSTDAIDRANRDKAIKRARVQLRLLGK